MASLKDAVFQEFGDEGAETLERYLAQIEYTAWWCIHLLISDGAIVAVIPEGVEDVVIERPDRIELRQVKTRNEPSGPWTTAEILPILCKLYHHRNAYQGKHCEFHFVSDRMADTKTKKKGYVPLIRLKQLLDTLHSGRNTLTPSEESELSQIRDALVPRICELMKKDHNEDIDAETAQCFIENTWIETDSVVLRAPECIGTLSSALDGIHSGASPYTTGQVREFYQRLISMIFKKIRKPTLAERRTLVDDVLGCRTSATPLNSPQLTDIPGTSILEKKAVLGGFDSTELPTFNRQRLLAEAKVRRLLPLGLAEEIERLSADVADQQLVCRRQVSGEGKCSNGVGPEILIRLRPRLSAVIERASLPKEYVDEQFCLGLAWRDTDNCILWWHALEAQKA